MWARKAHPLMEGIRICIAPPGSVSIYPKPGFAPNLPSEDHRGKRRHTTRVAHRLRYRREFATIFAFVSAAFEFSDFLEFQFLPRVRSEA